MFAATTIFFMLLRYEHAAAVAMPLLPLCHYVDAIQSAAERAARVPRNAR